MNVEDITRTLERHRARLPFGGLVDGRSGAPLALTAVKPNVYRLDSGTDSFLVKWIADDDRLGASEIASNESWLAAADIAAPPLIAAIDVEGGRIACWAWVAGSDLRAEHRGRLPDAFAALGRFHASARHDGPLRASPLSDDSHPSVRALVAAERDRLVPLVDEDLRPRFARLLDRLELGYGTIVHGDMHPGNVLLADGGLTFVDWSMARPSLNLFDLEYIESVDLEPPNRFWAYMQPAEAPAILAAYFGAAGMAGVDARIDAASIHLAVVAWQLACGYESIRERPERAPEAVVWRRRLEQAIGAMG